MGLQTNFDMATARATMADVPARIDLVTTDPWWNPTAEEQAMGRAHRIGQSAHRRGAD